MLFRWDRLVNETFRRIVFELLDYLDLLVVRARSQAVFERPQVAKACPVAGRSSYPTLRTEADAYARPGLRPCQPELVIPDFRFMETLITRKSWAAGSRP